MPAAPLAESLPVRSHGRRRRRLKFNGCREPSRRPPPFAHGSSTRAPRSRGSCRSGGRRNGRIRRREPVGHDVLPVAQPALRLCEQRPRGDPGRAGSLGQRTPPRRRRALLPWRSRPARTVAFGGRAAERGAADRLGCLLPRLRAAGRRRRSRPDRAACRRRERDRLGPLRRPEPHAGQRWRAFRLMPLAAVSAEPVRRLLPDPGHRIRRRERGTPTAGVLRRPTAEDRRACQFRATRGRGAERSDRREGQVHAVRNRARGERRAADSRRRHLPLLRERRQLHRIVARVRRGQLDDDLRRAADPSGAGLDRSPSTGAPTNRPAARSPATGTAVWPAARPSSCPSRSWSMPSGTS